MTPNNDQAPAGREWILLIENLEGPRFSAIPIRHEDISGTSDDQNEAIRCAVKEIDDRNATSTLRVKSFRVIPIDIVDPSSN